MRGLGGSIYPGNVDYTAFGEVHWVSAAEAVWTCRELTAHHYAGGGWSVGAVGMVAGWLARTLPAETRRDRQPTAAPGSWPDEKTGGALPLPPAEEPRGDRVESRLLSTFDACSPHTLGHDSVGSGRLDGVLHRRDHRPVEGVGMLVGSV